MVGLSDCKGLFQPKQFYDYVACVRAAFIFVSQWFEGAQQFLLVEVGFLEKRGLNLSEIRTMDVSGKYIWCLVISIFLDKQLPSPYHFIG